MDYSKQELKEYINDKIEANRFHLKMTENTQWHEPEWYDGAITALREMIDDLELDHV
jgi:hypothetical protein